MSDPVGRSRLDYRQQEIRRRARETLDAIGDGFEVTELFACPSLAWRLGEDLLDLLPPDSRPRLDIVAGTSTAGIILGHTMAGLLDSRRPLAGPACRFLAFDGRAADPLVLSPRLASCLRERRVLLVDAIYQPGGRLHQCVRLAREARADVVACAAICGPRRSLSEWPVPVITLCDRQCPTWRPCW